MGRNLFADDKQPLPNQANMARQGRNLFAKEEPEEGFGEKLPRNIGIGLANLGHTALNLPHDLTQGLEKQFQQFGNTINKASPLEKLGMNHPTTNFSLSKHIPYQQDYNFAQMLGQKGEPTWADSVIQKGIEYAPEFLMGGNALRNVIPHLTKRGATKKLNLAKQTFKDWAEMENNSNQTFFHGTPQKSADEILKKGLTAPKYSEKNALLTDKPETAKAYGTRINGGDEPGDLLRISIPKKELENYLHPENTDWVAQSLKPRGHEDAKIFGIKQPIPSKYISRIGENEPYHLPDKKNRLNVNPELIEDARQYLPNNLSERHLLNEAANDYDKLFNLQSQVGKVSAKRMGKLTSIFAPETRIKGEAGLEARRKLINAMHENLQSEGLHNTSNLFREGQNDYRRYMKFKPYRNAIALAGLGAVGNEVFPQNPLTDLVKKLIFHAAKS